MRTIKFRAKTKENEWVYGYYVYTYPNEHRIFGKDRTSIEVIPESVEQFTGSLDKTGKEIYEGDIVTSDTYPFVDGEGNQNYHGVVIWLEGGFVVETVRSAGTTVRGLSEGNVEHIIDFLFRSPEVIGNIHDNKELMRKEEK